MTKFVLTNFRQQKQISFQSVSNTYIVLLVTHMFFKFLLLASNIYEVLCVCCRHALLKQAFHLVVKLQFQGCLRL